jgi:thiosulfate/3-mercaptopyruvate sulfurtransferase
VTLRYGALRALTIDEAAAFPASGALLDARAGERFRGEVEPIDPRAGHIPGARSAPTTENVDADGRFLTPEQLRERFAALGVEPGTPVATYCGSGVTAAHEAVALALAGFDAALFPGSWSQWANHPELPVAMGAD